MNHQNVVEIKNADHRITSIKELNSRFLEHLKNHAQPEDLPALISVEDQKVTVSCFGQFVTAKPRIVIEETGLFAVEYIFYACQGENDLEIWKFYLTNEGRLTNWLDQGNSLCDFDNQYIAKYICVPVMHAALHSALFKPTERPVS